MKHASLPGSHDVGDIRKPRLAPERPRERTYREAAPFLLVVTFAALAFAWWPAAAFLLAAVIVNWSLLAKRAEDEG